MIVGHLRGDRSGLRGLCGSGILVPVPPAKEEPDQEANKSQSYYTPDNSSSDCASIGLLSSAVIVVSLVVLSCRVIAALGLRWGCSRGRTGGTSGGRGTCGALRDSLTFGWVY